MRKLCALWLLLLALCLSSCAGPVSPSSGKELLPVSYLPYLEIPQSDPVFLEVDLPYEGLQETPRCPYAGQKELAPFTDYFAQQLGFVPDSGWYVFVHFYDAEQTAGMVQFQYYAGPIQTSRSLVVDLNGGRADFIAYSSLDAAVDDADLQRRIALFEGRYEQEPYPLKKGESLSSESTTYSYYCETGELVYCYTPFYVDANGCIGNDYGTACFIEADGAARFK